MSETTTETKKVATLGKVTRAQMNTQNTDGAGAGEGAGDKGGEGAGAGAGAGTGDNTNTNTGGQQGAGAGAGAGEGAGAGTGDNKNIPPADLTEDQLKAHFEKLGIPYDGIDKLKEKLTKKDPVIETAEQKEEKQRAKEKRMLDLFLQGKGTVEQFAAIKNLASADVKELSQNELRRELKEAKFSDDKVDEIINEMFFQIADEELEKFEDETEKEFIKRKKEFGSKLLENRSLSIKQAAEQVLTGLEQAIESEDLQRQEEEQLSSKIDEHFQTIPRKVTLELGSENNRKLDPIEYDVTDAEIAEVQDLLKDPAKRNQFLFNEEGKLNLENLANVLLRNKSLEAIAKKSYLKGETDTTATLEKTFGARTAAGVGIGGSQAKTGDKGVATQTGKITRQMPSHKK